MLQNDSYNLIEKRNAPYRHFKKMDWAETLYIDEYL